MRRLLDDGRCNAYAPEYCLTRFRPEVDSLMETQLDSGSVTIVHYAAAKGRSQCDRTSSAPQAPADTR